MQVAVLTEKGFELREQPVPEYGPDEALVRTLSCGICSGEAHVCGGDAEQHTVRPVLSRSAQNALAARSRG